MADIKIKVDQRDIPKFVEVTVSVVPTHVIEARLRIAAAVWLIKLAGRIAPFRNVKVATERDDNA